MVKKIKYLSSTCRHEIRWNIYLANAMSLPFPTSVSSALVFCKSLLLQPNGN